MLGFKLVLNDLSDFYHKPRLLTPGPTAVPEPVLLEMARPMIHHRTKEFQSIYEEVCQKLQWLFRTESPVLCIAGSGTTSFEAAQVSLMKRGTKALTIAGGKFGERWQDVYAAYGVEQIKINVPWGQAVELGEIEESLGRHRDVSVVTMCHSETSTATVADIQAVAQLVAKTDALLIVDGITSVGAMPVEMDAWGIDVLVTGSQKSLMLPPGLGMVGLGPRAVARLEEIEPVGCYNLDLRRWLESWRKKDVPFTAPVSLIRGLQVALGLLASEGLEATWARTSGLASVTRAAVAGLGLQLISGSPSDSVTGVFYPDGVDDSRFRAALRDRYRIHIAGGQNGRGAKWKNKIFRISHMGYVDFGDTVATLVAIESELRRVGGITPSDPAGTSGGRSAVMAALSNFI